MKKLLIPKIKDVLPILVSSILPLLIFGGIVIGYSVRMSQEAAERENEIVASNLSGQIQSYLLHARDTVQSLAELPLPKIDQEILRSVYLNHSFGNMYVFESLMLLDEKGKIIFIYPERKEFLGFDYSRQPVFLEAKEKKETVFSGVAFSSITEQPVIAVAVPVFEPGPEKVVVGVVKASIRLQALSLLVKEFGLKKETGLAFLIGEYGEIIAHPDYRLVKERERAINVYPELAFELQKNEKKEGIFQYQDRAGNEFTIHFKTIFPTGWKLITQQDLREVLIIPNRLQLFLLTVLILTLFLAGGVSYNVSSYLERFRKERERIREERLKEVEEAKDVLEVRVRSRTKELEELNRELEKRVEERTEELQEKLEELEKFHKLAVDRELKMIELKEEIERLKNKNQ